MAALRLLRASFSASSISPLHGPETTPNRPLRPSLTARFGTPEGATAALFYTYIRPRITVRPCIALLPIRTTAHSDFDSPFLDSRQRFSEQPPKVVGTYYVFPHVARTHLKLECPDDYAAIADHFVCRQ